MYIALKDNYLVSNCFYRFVGPVSSLYYQKRKKVQCSSRLDILEKVY